MTPPVLNVLITADCASVFCVCISGTQQSDRLDFNRRFSLLLYFIRYKFLVLKHPILFQDTLVYVTLQYRGQGSVVGIATGYGLDDPAVESRCGRDFPHLSRRALGPTQPPVKWVPGLSQG